MTLEIVLLQMQLGKLRSYWDWVALILYDWYPCKKGRFGYKEETMGRLEFC